MDFCPKCDNVFSYDENIEERSLSFFCISCEIHAPITNVCLSTKTTKITHQTNINYENAIHDKTLPTRSNASCPKCKHTKIVFVRNVDLTATSICKECSYTF